MGYYGNARKLGQAGCCCGGGTSLTPCRVLTEDGSTARIPAGDLILDWYTYGANGGPFLVEVTTTLHYISTPTSYSWLSDPMLLPDNTAACFIIQPGVKAPCCWVQIGLNCTGVLQIRTGPTANNIGGQPCGGAGSAGFAMLVGAASASGDPFAVQYGEPGGGDGANVFANGILTS